LANKPKPNREKIRMKLFKRLQKKRAMKEVSKLADVNIEKAMDMQLEISRRELKEMENEPATTRKNALKEIGKTEKDLEPKRKRRRFH
jgi:hypothetical protein